MYNVQQTTLWRNTSVVRSTTLFTLVSKPQTMVQTDWFIQQCFMVCIHHRTNHTCSPFIVVWRAAGLNRARRDGSTGVRYNCTWLLGVASCAGWGWHGDRGHDWLTCSAWLCDYWGSTGAHVSCPEGWHWTVWRQWGRGETGGTHRGETAECLAPGVPIWGWHHYITKCNSPFSNSLFIPRRDTEPWIYIYIVLRWVAFVVTDF